MLFQASFIAVAIVFRPASVTCKNGARRTGSKSMSSRRTYLVRLSVLSQSTKTGRPHSAYGATVVKPTDVVRDLGVLLDRELTIKRHVSKTVSICFHHLRRLRELRRHVNIDTIKQLVSASPSRCRNIIGESQNFEELP